MSLLHIDGFEWDPQTLNENLQPSLGFGKATWLNPGATRVAGRRAGSNALRLPDVPAHSTAGGYARTLDANRMQLFAGAAVRIPNGIAGNAVLFHAFDVSMAECATIEVTPLGIVNVFNNGNLVNADGSKALAFDVWNYVEARLLAHASNGIIEIRVNNVLWLSITGLALSAASGFRSIGSGAPQTAQWAVRAGADFDDLYLADNAGTVNNTWLGDVRVDTLRPMGAGGHAQFAATPAGSNWDRVNEVDADLADFVQSSAVGQRDSYAYTDLPAMNAPTILGVQAVSLARKTDAGVASLRHLARIGATTYPAALASPLTLPAATHLTVWETSPAGGAWTWAGVNAAEFGVEAA